MTTAPKSEAASPTSRATRCSARSVRRSCWAPTQLTLPRFPVHGANRPGSPRRPPRVPVSGARVLLRLSSPPGRIRSSSSTTSISRRSTAHTFLAEDDMFTLEHVANTAFFVRTSAPTFLPLGDGWWLQRYNVRCRCEPVARRSGVVRTRALIELVRREAADAVISSAPVRDQMAGSGGIGRGCTAAQLPDRESFVSGRRLDVARLQFSVGSSSSFIARHGLSHAISRARRQTSRTTRDSSSGFPSGIRLSSCPAAVRWSHADVDVPESLFDGTSCISARFGAQQR